MTFVKQDGGTPISPHLWPDHFWTGQHRHALLRMKRSEQRRSHTNRFAGDRDLLWRLSLALEYLKDRADGLGKRQWKVYGKQAREQ